MRMASLVYGIDYEEIRNRGMFPVEFIFDDSLKPPLKVTYHQIWWYKFRDSQRYVKKPHHEKKNKEADPWRIHKKTRKDKSKRGLSRTSRKGFYKEGRRKERQWVRQCIQREEYDLLRWDWQRHYVNPWDWD